MDDDKGFELKAVEAIHRVVRTNAPWAYELLSEKLPLPESKPKKSLAERFGIN